MESLQDSLGATRHRPSLDGSRRQESQTPEMKGLSRRPSARHGGLAFTRSTIQSPLRGAQRSEHRSDCGGASRSPPLAPDS